MMLPLSVTAERGFMAYRRVSIVDAAGRVVAQLVQPKDAALLVEIINSVMRVDDPAKDGPQGDAGGGDRPPG
jgi:hypothetical protein